jgi:hypothetical protein
MKHSYHHGEWHGQAQAEHAKKSKQGLVTPVIYRDMRTVTFYVVIVWENTVKGYQWVRCEWMPEFNNAEDCILAAKKCFKAGQARPAKVTMHNNSVADLEYL